MGKFICPNGCGEPWPVQLQDGRTVCACQFTERKPADIDAELRECLEAAERGAREMLDDYLASVNQVRPLRMFADAGEIYEYMVLEMQKHRGQDGGDLSSPPGS
jgi:hypothetical protein